MQARSSGFLSSLLLSATCGLLASACGSSGHNTDDPSEGICECQPEYKASPLCAQVPGQSPSGEMQYFGRAFPGLRHLEVLRGYSERGGQATLGSICPRDVSDDSQPSYGYRPTMQTLLEQLTPVLRAPAR